MSDSSVIHENGEIFWPAGRDGSNVGMLNFLVNQVPVQVALDKKARHGAVVPTPGEDMPPLYYAEQSGLFVRADITFIRQDFSVFSRLPIP